MSVDLVLVGGGLANSLIAFRLLQIRPELELLVVERQDSLGGTHVWSFHAGDLTPEQNTWLAPLITKSWPRYEVRFPHLQRSFESSYSSLTSRHLDRELRARLGRRALVGTEVVAVEPHRIRTADGRVVEAGAVIDGRGDTPSNALTVAFQKFVGLTVELEEPTDLSAPILMDATVEQLDGYRFLYTLPFTDRSLLIEDTVYSDTPSLDREQMRRRISRYAAAQGWRIARVVGEEEGILPIVLSGAFESFWSEASAGIPRAGMRAALFHQTTGYSLPEAVRLADEIALSGQLESAALERLVRHRAQTLWRRSAFFRLLNRMLFLAAEPERRVRVLERFYTLPAPLIERFYAGRPSVVDRLRILTGKPPVPLSRAIRCLSPASATRAKPANPPERKKPR